LRKPPTRAPGSGALRSIDTLIRRSLRAEAARTRPPPRLAERSLRRFQAPSGYDGFIIGVYDSALLAPEQYSLELLTNESPIFRLNETYRRQKPPEIERFQEVL